MLAIFIDDDFLNFTDIMSQHTTLQLHGATRLWLQFHHRFWCRHRLRHRHCWLLWLWSSIEIITAIDHLVRFRTISTLRRYSARWDHRTRTRSVIAIERRHSPIPWIRRCKATKRRSVMSISANHCTIDSVMISIRIHKRRHRRRTSSKISGSRRRRA